MTIVNQPAPIPEPLPLVTVPAGISEELASLPYFVVLDEMPYYASSLSLGSTVCPESPPEAPEIEPSAAQENLATNQPVIDWALAVLECDKVYSLGLTLFNRVLPAIELTGLLRNQGTVISTNLAERTVRLTAVVLDTALQANYVAVLSLSLTSTSTAENLGWELKVSVERLDAALYELPIAASYLKFSVKAPLTYGQADVVETQLNSRGVQANPWVPSDLNTFLAKFSKSLAFALSA